MDFERVLRSLGREGLLIVESSDELAASVHEMAIEKAKKDRDFDYHKKPVPVPVRFNGGLITSPAEVLRQVGVATTFFTSTPFADIARTWAQIRYCATLESTLRNRMVLTKEGANNVVHHHKVAQSEQLGIGFALVVAQNVLQHQYPGWEFSPVDVDVALRAGGIEDVGDVEHADKVKKRPDYFLIGRRTSGGGRVKIVVLECKGTHDSTRHVIEQLAKACVQVRGVQIGGRTPHALMVASYLSTTGITAYVLDPPGDEDDLWVGPEDEMDELLALDPGNPPEEFQWRRPREDENSEIPEMQEAVEDKGEGTLSEPGVWTGSKERDAELRDEHKALDIPKASKRWFFQILARTAAASALLFAGDDRTAVEYTTRRQRGLRNQDGELPFAEFETEFSTAQQFELPGGLSFQGTRYVMPLGRRRSLEIHRGLEDEMYQHLTEQRVGQYLRAAHRVRRRWREVSRNAQGAGEAISVGRDGTALRIRIVN